MSTDLEKVREMAMQIVQTRAPGAEGIARIDIQRLVQAPLGRDCLSPECQREKAMAPHSSTLAWKIPWMEEPGVLPSRGSHRVGHD